MLIWAINPVWIYLIIIKQYNCTKEKGTLKTILSWDDPCHDIIYPPAVQLLFPQKEQLEWLSTGSHTESKPGQLESLAQPTMWRSSFQNIPHVARYDLSNVLHHHRHLERIVGFDKTCSSPLLFGIPSPNQGKLCLPWICKLAMSHFRIIQDWDAGF